MRGFERENKSQEQKQQKYTTQTSQTATRPDGGSIPRRHFERARGLMRLVEKKNPLLAGSALNTRTEQDKIVVYFSVHVTACGGHAEDGLMIPVRR